MSAVSITRLRVRSWQFLPAFLFHTILSPCRRGKQQGFICNIAEGQLAHLLDSNCLDRRRADEDVHALRQSSSRNAKTHGDV